MRTFFWVVVGLVAAFFVFELLVFGCAGGGYDNRRAAISQAHLFLKACEFYRHFPDEDGKLPATLTDLVAPDPKSGRKPLVEGGKDALLDPWGKPYRYVVIETEAGTEAYVWAEREYQGKLSIYGAKLSANGRVRMFNIPTN